MTLAIGWPHEVGENLRTWPHEGGVWQVAMGSGDEDATSALLDLHVFRVHLAGTRSPWTTSHNLSADSDTRVLGRG